VHTLVLLEPEQLDEAEQERLYQWLEHEGRAVLVVSIIFRPLFPRVVSGQFRDDLYYRLNMLFLECTDRLRLLDGAPERWSDIEELA
jgi:transcriptional regulator with PAS, ATPase and Fis domain